MQSDKIVINGACEHNLKSVNLTIPKRQLVVITGLSGSGKSSIAFDTIHAEGKRLYLESMTSYLRQFESNDKPKVDFMSGLSPSIAIDQKSLFKNPRSTVATISEIYDYLRVLFASIGVPHSPVTNLPINKQSPEEMVERIIEYADGRKFAKIMAQITKNEKGDHKKSLINVRKKGYNAVKVNDVFYTFDTLPMLDKDVFYTIYAVFERFSFLEVNRDEILGLVKEALDLGNGVICVEYEESTELPAVEVANSNDDSEQSHKKDGCLFLSEVFKCPVSDFVIPEITARIFSFNNPYGACEMCGGLGIEYFLSPDIIIPDTSLTINEGAILPWSYQKLKNKSTDFIQYKKKLEVLSKKYNFSLDIPYVALNPEIQNMLLYGEEVFFYKDKDKATTEVSTDKSKNKSEIFEGVIPIMERQAKVQGYLSSSSVDNFNSYRDTRVCSNCDGHRLSKNSLCIKVNGVHIGDVCAMSITSSIKWFRSLLNKLSEKDLRISEKVIGEILMKLSRLESVGLGYLTLSRRFSTLSGGESQRLRLIMQIGYSLTDVIYVLDEPSVGLHQADNAKLLEMLFALRDLGNTVIVVEHDEDTIRAADFIVDMGKGAGIYGGNVIVSGTISDVLSSNDSITAQYLTGKMSISMPKNRRKGRNFITVFDAYENNLKNVTASIPLNSFVAVTGVSGSGKSTFVMSSIQKGGQKFFRGAKLDSIKCSKISGFEYIDQIISVDQSSIGRTHRSNPATYTNTFGYIRDYFASLDLSRDMGYSASRFSFNMKGGRCEHCEGEGVTKIEMYLLPDVYVQCEECCGKRYNSNTLNVKYKDKSIADVLEMTVDEALELFSEIQDIKDKLTALKEVGLGYIKMGQPATTLSGGEAQRIKLARELSKKYHGNTLYILDEPTTGLHMDDVKRLMNVLHKLVDYGNSVLVIEHNIDVIKTADYIVDFGPGSGDAGGTIVACGTPEEIAGIEGSLTGKYLKRYFS